MAPSAVAELHAFWGDPEALPPALRRRYKTEREYRLGCPDRAYDPGNDDTDWIIQEIRSGEWERRTQRNTRNLRRDQARLAQWKRDGYSFDAEHRLVAPVRTTPCAPRRAATTSRARPGARRATARAAHRETVRLTNLL